MIKPQEIKLYGDIGTWKNNGETFTDTLDKIEKTGCKELIIRMHCYGGSVFEGNVMFNALQRSKMKVKIIIDGIAASMASVFLIAADEVEIAENGFIMIHTPSGLTQGNAKVHEQTTKLLYDLEANFSKQYANRTGLSIDQVKAQWFDGNDHWLNAEEAVKYNFASRKIPALSKGVEGLDKEAVLTMNVKSVYDRYTAILTNSNNNEQEMKKELIDYFQFPGITEESPDEEVIQLIKDKFEELQQQAEQNNAEGEAAKNKTVKSMVSDALKAGKITNDLCATYEMVGKASGIDALSTILASIVKRPSIVSMITPEIKGDAGTPQKKDKKNWTLDDYRMHAPRELRDNPKLYDQLVEKEHGKE